MPKIILILFFVMPAQAAITKVCDNLPAKKAVQFEANNKQVAAAAKSITGDKAIKIFRTSSEYEWAVIANPGAIGKLRAAKDRDYCAETYQDFIKEKDTKKSQETLEFWRACLNSNYRDEIPKMAKNILKCHGAKSTEDISNETKSNPDQE